jgi:catechol 2,3-dioxygenase
MPTAAFVSAGGYHHHLAFNLWRGAGVPEQPVDVIGLRHWTIVLPSVDAVRERAEKAGVPVEDREGELVLRDPWGLELHVSQG